MSRGRVPAVVLVGAMLLVVAAVGTGCEGGPGAAGEGTEGDVSSTADSLVGAWIQAAGGPAAWDSVQTLRYTVTTVLYDSTETVEWMRPRRVSLKKTDRGFMGRIERPEAEGLYVQAFTGDTLWATLNDRPLPPDHPATQESEYVNRDVLYWIGLPWKLRDPGVNMEARSVARGHEVTVTFGSGVGEHPGDRYFYRFLDGDPFPEEVHYIEQGTEGRTRTEWRNFRTEPPITYVGTRRYVDEEGRTTKELRIHDVVINPGLPDSIFASPGRRGP